MQHTNPYLMNCPRCNAVNDTDAKFCKSCALPLTPYQPSAHAAAPVNNNDPSLNFMIIILGLFCFESLFYKFLEYVVAPIVNDGRDYGERMSTIYTICSWGFNLVTMVLATIFVVKAKNKLVKIILIIYGATFLVNFILYNIAPLFRGENDFVYFNF